MRVIFAGVGEAFDEHLENTSLLVLADSGKRKRQILLDCGFTGAHSFWRVSPAPLDLDAVWISHFHGDHFFGLPLLVLRYWEADRKRPLTIVGQEGIEDRINEVLDLAYPDFRSKLQYPLQFKEVSPGKDLDLFGVMCSFAENGHSKRCLAIRLEYEGCSVFYSGDGGPTEQTRVLAQGCDLIVHESFGLTEAKPGHGTLDRCIDLARVSKAKAFALVHLNRDVRRFHGEEIKRRLAGLNETKGFLPQAGDDFDLKTLITCRGGNRK